MLQWMQMHYFRWATILRIKHWGYQMILIYASSLVVSDGTVSPWIFPSLSTDIWSDVWCVRAGKVPEMCSASIPSDQDHKPVNFKKVFSYKDHFEPPFPFECVIGQHLKLVQKYCSKSTFKNPFIYIVHMHIYRSLRHFVNKKTNASIYKLSKTSFSKQRGWICDLKIHLKSSLVYPT